MNLDRPLVLAIAATAAILVAGGSVLAIRAAAVDEAQERSKALVVRYEKAYTVGALDERSALVAESAAGAATLAVLAQCERDVITIPDAYLATDLNVGTSLVQSDLLKLSQRSRSAGVEAPATFPFMSGLAADETQRLVQLAQLHAVKSILTLCIDVQVKRIAAIRPEKASSDPGGTYALFSCAVEVEADWEAVARLLEAIQRGDGRGLVLTSLRIEPSPSAQRQVQLGIGQVFRNVPAWKLNAAGRPAVPGGVAAPVRSRLQAGGN